MGLAALSAFDFRLPNLQRGFFVEAPLPSVLKTYFMASYIPRAPCMEQHASVTSPRLSGETRFTGQMER